MMATSTMTLSPTSHQNKLEQSKEEEKKPAFTTVTCDASDKEEEESKEPMVTPTGTSYLSKAEEYSPQEMKFPPLRVQSTHSLLGLAGLEGHEESEEDVSTAGISAVTEEQDVTDIVISPSTQPTSPSENHEIEDDTCNTTPPGSVQGPGIFSLSPPRLTTYSVGSTTSASVTESFVLQPRPIQSGRQTHLPQESPRFSRSPLVQQPQLHTQPQPRSRPPRAPHHPSNNPMGNNGIGSGPLILPRAGVGAEPSSLSGAGISGSGHSRTPTDATNYSFLSSLTDVSGGEYSAPRRRTLSWDSTGNSKKVGQFLESKSLGVPSTPGSILQPILLTDEIESEARPPMSISASNLRKALPITTTTTTPTPASSRNTNTTLLLAPSSLPSRENLHPLIQTLQNAAQENSTPFMPYASLPSSNDENTLHPRVQRLQDSSPSKSVYTASTSTSSPFGAHVQDEKKDDDSGRSRPGLQKKAIHDRKQSDYNSFSSSLCSSTTIRLQKQTASPVHSLGAFERRSISPQRRSQSSVTGDSKHNESTRLDFREFLMATKEGTVETEIINGIEGKGGNFSNDSSQFYNWPYILLAWGVLNMGAGFRVGSSSIYNNLAQFCLGLGAATVAKRKLSKTIFDGIIIGHYLDKLSTLKKIWIVLNRISDSSMTEKEDNSNAASKHVLRFRRINQYVDAVKCGNFPSSFEEHGVTREMFFESSQAVYEQLVKRDARVALSFENLCTLFSLSDSSEDEAGVQLLSDLFSLSPHEEVSKFDFVRTIDRTYKTTIMLIANMNNFSRICYSFDQILSVTFFGIALILAPTIVGVDTDMLFMTLFGLSINFAFIICFTSAEILKGIIHLVTQNLYDVGDRVFFVNPEEKYIESNIEPPSGGWIVEKIDLFKTTLRQGITGERSSIANGSALLTKSRLINWKRSHNATVTLSVDFSGQTGRNQVLLLRRQISEWIENRPREWTRLESLRMVSVDTQQQRVKYNVILRHKESWHNYASVQDSKSDIIVFLHELQNSSKD